MCKKAGKISQIEANKHLKAFCDQNNWDFMNHTTTIDSSSLNMRGLHLNRKGTTTTTTTVPYPH